MSRGGRRWRCIGRRRGFGRGSAGASDMAVFMCMAHCLASRRSRPRAFARSPAGWTRQTAKRAASAINLLISPRPAPMRQTIISTITPSSLRVLAVRPRRRHWERYGCTAWEMYMGNCQTRLVEMISACWPSLPQMKRHGKSSPAQTRRMQRRFKPKELDVSVGIHLEYEHQCARSCSVNAQPLWSLFRRDDEQMTP